MKNQWMCKISFNKIIMSMLMNSLFHSSFANTVAHTRTSNLKCKDVYQFGERARSHTRIKHKTGTTKKIQICIYYCYIACVSFVYGSEKQMLSCPEKSKAQKELKKAKEAKKQQQQQPKESNLFTFYLCLELDYLRYLHDLHVLAEWKWPLFLTNSACFSWAHNVFEQQLTF